MDEFDKKQDRTLEVLFAAAKADDPVPSGDLMVRIMADAIGAQKPTVAPISTPERRGFGQTLSDVFGGWAGATTLVACVGLGVVVGFASPDVVLSYLPGAEFGLGDDVFGLYFESEL
ncbi:MAG: dihydroorotate dehydrogenase [Amylibacter sp.]